VLLTVVIGKRCVLGKVYGWFINCLKGNITVQLLNELLSIDKLSACNFTLHTSLSCVSKSGRTSE